MTMKQAIDTSKYNIKDSNKDGSEVNLANFINRKELERRADYKKLLD